MTDRGRPTWLAGLSDEELAFIRRFVLASGSLKEVARVYGISYPTVRLRLDRLITKIQLLEETAESTAFERALQLAHTEGKLDLQTMKELLEAHRRDLEERVKGRGS